MRDADFGRSYERERKRGLHNERHFSPVELAEMWALSAPVIRELFADEPGVIKIGKPSRRIGRSLKRSYYSLRIPESVAERVHRRLAA